MSPGQRPGRRAAGPRLAEATVSITTMGGAKATRFRALLESLHVRVADAGTTGIVLTDDYLRDALHAVRAAVSRPVTVDASGVDYCDGAGIALLVFGLRLARRLSQRLKSLESGVTAIAAGDYQASVAEAPRDEIGRLGSAINRMRTDLLRARDRLLEDQKQLEARVLERTAELAEAHKESEHLAYNDSLTELPNRRMFATLLERRVFIRSKLSSSKEAIAAVEQSGGVKFTYIGDNMAFQDTLPSRGRRTKAR